MEKQPIELLLILLYEHLKSFQHKCIANNHG